jgi:hypothetical protein
VLVERKPSDQKVDMFALGLIFYEMWTRFGGPMERDKALAKLKATGKIAEEHRITRGTLDSALLFCHNLFLRHFLLLPFLLFWLLLLLRRLLLLSSVLFSPTFDFRTPLCDVFAFEYFPCGSSATLGVRHAYVFLLCGFARLLCPI